MLCTLPNGRGSDERILAMEILNLLNLSIQKNASDLHLSPGLPPILRTDGNLQFLTDICALDANEIKQHIYNLLDEKQQKELDTNLECDFSINVSSLANFRLNVFHQANGLAAVFRIIPKKILTLDELESPAIFKELLYLSQGLILVTGPTGSGKSTTLAAMVEFINQHRACHIITIEDPIEFSYISKKSLINQRQIKRDTHDFSAALRSALREDPDIILLGEMRDLETIRLALTAAETGHLVIATLHTSSAPRTISRIIDVFPNGEKNIIRNMLSESLQAVIFQNLIKKNHGGRVAAYEIMLATTAIKNLIREDKIMQINNAMQTGNEVGMCTLEQSIQTLLRKQIISLS